MILISKTYKFNLPVAPWISIPTIDRLISRHVNINPLCQCCCLEDETINYVLFICPFVQSNTLRAYSDNDWTGCKDTRRSTKEFCTFLGTNSISWFAKRYPTVSKSSTKAEYRSLSIIALELKWINSLLNEVGFLQSTTTVMYCDNLCAVYLTTNLALHSISKHIDVDFYYVCERVALGVLVVKHTSTLFSWPIYSPSHFLRYLSLTWSCCIEKKTLDQTEILVFKAKVDLSPPQQAQNAQPTMKPIQVNQKLPPVLCKSKTEHTKRDLCTTKPAHQFSTIKPTQQISLQIMCC